MSCTTPPSPSPYTTTSTLGVESYISQRTTHNTYVVRVCILCVVDQWRSHAGISSPFKSQLCGLLAQLSYHLFRTLNSFPLPLLSYLPPSNVRHASSFSRLAFVGSWRRSFRTEWAHLGASWNWRNSQTHERTVEVNLESESKSYNQIWCKIFKISFGLQFYIAKTFRNPLTFTYFSSEPLFISMCVEPQFYFVSFGIEKNQTKTFLAVGMPRKIWVSSVR